MPLPQSDRMVPVPLPESTLFAGCDPRPEVSRTISPMGPSAPVR